MQQPKHILICAGGTGGHLFPAQALAKELSESGWEIHLATDERAARFTSDFPAQEIHVVKSATFSGKNPFKLLRALFRLGAGYRQSRALVAKIKPAVAVGFGGYPTVPPIIAAAASGASILLHEQNAVMGRANRMLQNKAYAVAVGFGVENVVREPKTIIIGNPVREPVLEAAKIAYPKRKTDDPFKLLVFGGSQGARFFSLIMPQALRLLAPEQLRNLKMVQQARPEDENELKQQFDQIGIKYQVSPFFSNMAEHMAKSHLIIGRGGASTVSECATIGRPSVLVPLPGALDDDQAKNAEGLAKSGGCKVIRQVDLSPEKLAQELTIAISHPRALEDMACQAKQTGKPEAAKNLARLVEHIHSGHRVSTFEGYEL